MGLSITPPTRCVMAADTTSAPDRAESWTAGLIALAERAESATGADHVLDAHIICLLRGYTVYEETDPANGYFAFWQGEPWKSTCHNTSSWPDYTASLDAVLALVAEKLPGWAATLNTVEPCAPVDEPHYASAEVWRVCDRADDD